MSTENIVKFLQTAYSDGQLAALLAHAQDGKLAYNSCCCLVGAPTADHPLQAEYPLPREYSGTGGHIHAGRLLDGAGDAEFEYCSLGIDHSYADNSFAAQEKRRRERIIPLILAEMERRELAQQYRAEEEAAAEEGALIEASGYPDPQFESNGRY